MSARITPVILCGGSGTRLWPLSRKSFPKQFVPLVGGRSLLELTAERVAALADDGEVMAVASEDHRFLVDEALRRALARPARLLLEPQGRNTAAAMALAALAVAEGEPQALLLFCPADHHMPEVERFQATVRQGVAAAQAGAIVTFGICPTFPSTAYGYLAQGAPRGDAASFQVHRFIEKPDAEQAQALLLGAGVLWNAGIFLARADVLCAALAQHAPDILECCRHAMGAATRDANFVRPEPSAFAACRAQSIDYAVMERHGDVAVVPYAGRWSDVGSWNAVAELQPADAAGNRIVGQGMVQACRNTFIHAPHRLVVALGTDDLLIVDTPDALLVTRSDAAEQVRDVVARLQQDHAEQAVTHRRVARPWGWYDSVDAGERFQVKRIAVKPGASLSLQRHHHRAEHWIVVKGTAEVTCGDRTFLVTENESTYIPLGERHRLHNPGRVPLEMIEVQSGSYLGEDDIVRYEDSYGRAQAPQSPPEAVAPAQTPR